MDAAVRAGPSSACEAPADEPLAAELVLQVEYTIMDIIDIMDDEKCEWVNYDIGYN